MSGPPYPRVVVPGEFDWWLTVLSQYANSPILTTLLSNMFECLNQDANMDAFFDNIWNIDTAVGYGLDVWGRIIGVSRVLQVATGSFFGFTGPSGASGDPFNVSPFYSGTPDTDNVALTDDAYRTLLFAKALFNISDGSIKSTNAILRTLFSTYGNAYCTDGLNMTMTYTFNFALSPLQQAIVENSGALPRPSGVAVTAIFP